MAAAARPPLPLSRIKRPMHCGSGGAQACGPRRRRPLRRPPAAAPVCGPAAAPCYQSPPSGAAGRGAARGCWAGALPAAGRSVVRRGGGDALEHKELAALNDLLGRLPVLNHAPPHLRVGTAGGEQAGVSMCRAAAGSGPSGNTLHRRLHMHCRGCFQPYYPILSSVHSPQAGSMPRTGCSTRLQPTPPVHHSAHQRVVIGVGHAHNALAELRGHHHRVVLSAKGGVQPARRWQEAG